MSKQSGKKKITPMMQQYLEIRQGLDKDTLLLFRLGDFYEMFESDAYRGSKLLGITLTHRNGQPMAGIPYHAADTYIQKLLAQGRKVAICDQMEAPRPGQIVKRALTRILTPGTRLEDHQIDATRGQYLLALDAIPAKKKQPPQLLAAWLDLTTGDFQICSEMQPDDLLPVLSALDASEALLPEDTEALWQDDESLQAWVEAVRLITAGRAVNRLPGYHFDAVDGARTVMETLGVLNLEGFGMGNDHPALGCAGALITYATESLCAEPRNLRRLQLYRSQQSLLLDPATLRNLEIFRNSSGGNEGTLLQAMDATVTAPGARLLQRYLQAPSRDLAELQRRQNCVGAFLEAPGYTGELRDYLKHVRDLPRILGRLQNRLRHPREPAGLRDTLQQLPLIVQTLEAFDSQFIDAYLDHVRDFTELRYLLERALNDELPAQLKDGNVIRDGYDTELDRYRSLTRDSRQWIADLERSEQERTGIKNLRIKYNGAFGYFIEVTKSNLDRVPDDYTRKQTMVNAERFVTPELKTKEEEIASAEEKALAREESLFAELIERILREAEALELTAQALAELDLYAGWSALARTWDYCRPQLEDSLTLEIEAGRHPVVEQMLRRLDRPQSRGSHAFVPNDCNLSADAEQIGLITGPNMAGKSTYIRQVALIVLMAQVGCWVPAKTCRIGLVDRIFSRVGASDELARGNSTFMVEMTETANILNNATEHSLIILDEIGRGTATYDGLSIAWAVVEYLHGERPAGPRTLFATHYHELTQIARQLHRVRNYSVAVKEWNDQIIFVHQIVAGAADKSYGIQVARLAGLPESVINRAKDVLAKLEADDSAHNLLRQRQRKLKQAEDSGEDAQLGLF